jgi:hypothetical protein
MRLPHEDLAAMDDEARAWELLAPWDVHPGNARLERHAVYTFNARYAERWRAGRVLLAGDAAHLMPPFAGQGMCAGIRDAANLAWKLHFVVAGLAGDALLDTYEAERLPSARRAIEFSMELGKVICVPDADEAAARDEAMAASVGADPTEAPPLPGIEAGFLHPGSPAAGSAFVQGSVEGRRFDDVHGAGWRLVAAELDRGELDPSLLSWFESIGGRVVVVEHPGPALGRWFAEHDVVAALQRPDFHVYATATDVAGADAMLTHLRTHLASPDRQGAPA